MCHICMYVYVYVKHRQCFQVLKLKKSWPDFLGFICVNLKEASTHCDRSNFQSTVQSNSDMHVASQRWAVSVQTSRKGLLINVF